MLCKNRTVVEWNLMLRILLVCASVRQAHTLCKRCMGMLGDWKVQADRESLKGREVEACKNGGGV